VNDDWWYKIDYKLFYCDFCLPPGCIIKLKYLFLNEQIKILMIEKSGTAQNESDDML